MRNISNLSCIGCGSKIQCDDNTQLGYVLPKLLEDDSLESLVCHRCFQIRHYNKITKNDLDIKVYEDIFNKNVNKNALFIYLVDVFDFEGTFLDEINDLLRDKNFIVVANKVDLLPKSLKPYKLENIIRHRLNKENMKCIDCYVTSIIKKQYVDEILEKIDRHRRNRDVYIVGVSNVGKSTFINALLKSVGIANKGITTSVIPGTTIDLIEIPFFDDNKFLIDTPGIINKGNLLNHVDPANYKLIMPNKEINARNYQLNPEQSIIMNGFACFSFLKGEAQTITFYFSNNIKLHRTKLEKSTELFTSRNKELFNVDNYEYDEFTFKTKESCELVILGLGFIRVSSGEFSVKVVKGTKVIKRDGFIG
ncbi:MAG: ribosome biogenesis GTPase YqeH [bacterium]